MWQNLRSPQIAWSLPQLWIRYTLQLGLVPLPKSSNRAHMRANADVDFVIADDDMTVLEHLEDIADYGDVAMSPVYGGT